MSSRNLDAYEDNEKNQQCEEIVRGQLMYYFGELSLEDFVNKDTDDEFLGILEHY